MAVITYRETTSAPGAWDAVLAPGRPITRERVRDILSAACTPENPVTAALEERDGSVHRVALWRDPSAEHGTPSVEDCAAFAKQLAAAEGWRARDGAPESLPTAAVMLGLREGYDLDATVHPADIVERRLDAFGYAPVHLFYARHRSKVRPYDEPGVVIGIDPADLPAVVDLARELRQERFVVIDYPANRTYVMSRTG